MRAYNSFSRNMKNIGREVARRYEAHTSLNASDFIVKFIHEGGLEIRLPKIRIADYLSGQKRQKISNTYAFSHRANAEALLRRLVFDFYRDGTLDKDKSIIDIGAWISDNSIIWSTLIDSDKASVYAIDPSAENIEFGKVIAQLNGRQNISWHVAACAESEGQPLYYQGSLGHTRFNQEGDGQASPVKTTTLDALVGENNQDKIGLVHIDVEGMEKEVLAGAKEIISRSKPAVLFEQHLGEEDPLQVFALLKDHGYKLYMINEILSNSATNCRNFFALPPDMVLPELPPVDPSSGRQQGIVYATSGTALIPYPTA